MAIERELPEGNDLDGDGQDTGGGFTRPTTEFTPPSINVSSTGQVTVTPGFTELVETQTEDVDEEREDQDTDGATEGKGVYEPPVIARVIGNIPSVSLSSANGGTPEKRINLLLGNRTSFSVRVDRSSLVGNITVQAIKAAGDADITISAPFLFTETNGSVIASYTIESRGTTTGNFRIDVTAHTVGVDNEPLKSSILNIYGKISLQDSNAGGGGGTGTVIPLRSVVQISTNQFELAEEGSTRINAFQINTNITNTLPDFEILSVSLDIIDPLYNPPEFLDKRFSATRISNSFSFNVTAEDFRHGQDPISGTLTVTGKTNTVEVQTITDEFIFSPKRNILNLIQTKTAVIDLENGTRGNIELFQINSPDIIVESVDVDSESDQVIFHDTYRIDDTIGVVVDNVTGTRPVSFIARMGVRYNNSDEVFYISNTGTITTTQIPGPHIFEPVTFYVEINNSIINIDESKGETQTSKLIVSPKSNVVSGIQVLPIAGTPGMSVIPRVDSGKVYIDVGVQNFDLAKGGTTISVEVLVSLVDGSNSTTKTVTVQVPIYVKAIVATPAPTQFDVSFNITPTIAHTISNLVEVQELDSQGTPVDVILISNGQLRRSWTRGTRIRIIPIASTTFDNKVFNIQSVAGINGNIMPSSVNGRFVYDFIVGPNTTQYTIDYEVNAIGPNVSANFSPENINIRNGQIPPASPDINITYSNATKIQIVGIGFNNSEAYEFDVQYSTKNQYITEYLPWNLFDNSYGAFTVNVIASNRDGLISQAPVTINFIAVTEPPPTTGRPERPKIPAAGIVYGPYITDVRISQPAIENGHTLTVDYDIRNVGQLILSDGTGNDRLANVHVGVVTPAGNSVILSSNIPTLKTRKINITLPEGSYTVFAEIENRTFPIGARDSIDTRLFANTILSILPQATPPPPPPLTIDDIINALVPVINDQLGIGDSFTNVINDRKILRNLLVSEDSRREYLITNYIKDVDSSVILKLYDPLDQSEVTKGRHYIAYELIDPFITNVELKNNVTTSNFSLRGANFNIDDQTDLGMPISNINLIDISSAGSTGLLRYDELLNFKTENSLLTISDTDLDGSGYILSGSITTDILNDIISGRLVTDDGLGIDFTNYGNFVFYSSALERLANFKYKLGLIESKTTSRNFINSSSVSASIAVRDEINQYNVQINEVTTTFDGYEKFLYFETGSTSWPKINGRLEATTASLAVNYYVSQSGVSELYDDANQYNLHKDLPEHIRRDPSNTDFLLFISMIGHHFDLIKVHIDAINRLFVRSHDPNVGTPTKLVKKLLESFGWQIRTRGAQEDLVNYLLGKKRNGDALSSTSAKAREEELHRRFLNNLPYVLKAKGTRASIRALFNMYGIPSSIIRLYEFGGPKLTTDAIRYYTFDDSTQILNMSGSNQVQLDIIASDLNRKPDSFEITFRTANKPAGHGDATSGSYQLLTAKDLSNSYVTLNVDSVPGSDFNGKLRLVVSGSAGVTHVTSSKFPIFDNDLYTVGLIRSRAGTTDVIDMYVKKSIYELFTHETSASISVARSMWESSSLMQIGNDFYGSVSEFRAWKRPLSETAYDRHVLYNESTSGDHYTSSLNDLLIRIPFERPQNLNTNTILTNFALTGSNGYMVAAATASNFASITADPYQFEYIDINSATEIPSIGFRADTDKIRFESQSLIDTAALSVSTRITKKQFDDAPVDSNKLGVFISPVDEVNRDIVRAFGGLDFMNEIGDPAAYYSSSYSSLDTINEHYWSRHSAGMNIYDYITLARQFDKTVFDYLDDVKPARVKLVKGLLIEPHILERNKVQHKRPTKENLFWDGTIDASMTASVQSEYPTYESNNVDLATDFILVGDFPTYTDTVEVESDLLVATGEQLNWDGIIDAVIPSTNITGSYPVYSATIRANVTHSISVDYEETSKLTVIGFEENFKIPKSLSPTFTGGGYGEPQSAFGLFAKNGYTDIIFIKEGVRKQRRFKIELINLIVSRSVDQLINGTLQGQAGEYHTVVVGDTYTVLNILHATASFTANSERVDGYLPFHRIYTSDLTLGMRNSYYNGSKTGVNSFVDDTKAVEIFISKPGILKVNKKGDSEVEPILQIE